MIGGRPAPSAGSKRSSAALPTAVAVADARVERKLVDRAKAILISDHGYSEADAYKRMRSMAMSKGKRLAEIAEAIILAKELSA